MASCSGDKPSELYYHPRLFSRWNAPHMIDVFPLQNETREEYQLSNSQSYPTSETLPMQRVLANLKSKQEHLRGVVGAVKGFG